MQRSRRAAARLMGRLLTLAAVILSSAAAHATPANAATAPALVWHHPQNPDPFRGRPAAVDCVGANWCMIVDQSGQAVRYHDGHWDRPVRIERAAGYSGLQTMSCGSRRSCMAVDAGGRLTHFNGKTWSHPGYVSSDVFMDNVSCPRATFCMALGSRVATWNGSTWRLSRSPLPRHRSGTSLACTSAKFCMTTSRVRHNKVKAWKYAHGHWSFAGRLRKLFDDPPSLSCTSHDFCMAVGSAINYERWDGAHWHGDRVETDAWPFSPVSVSCTSSRRCVTVGMTQHPQSAEWDGTTWRRPRSFDSSPSEAVTAVSCVRTELHCLAVDEMGGVTWYTHSTWHRTTTRDRSWGAINDVSCGTTMCIDADRSGGYVRTTGSGWSKPRRSYPNANFSSRAEGSLSCTADTFCLELAVNGAARRYDGHAWHPAPHAPVTGPVSCVSAHWCAAIDGNSGQLAVYKGGTWRKRLRPLGDRGELWTLSCGSRSLCLASTGTGFTRVYNGSRWGAKKRVGPGYDTLSTESCVSATFCMVGGGWNTTWRYDGAHWHKIRNSGTEYAISCTSATFCAGVGNGEVRTFDGRSWTHSITLRDPDGLPYQEIGCASRRLCVVSSPANRVEVGTTP